MKELDEKRRLNKKQYERSANNLDDSKYNN